MDYVIDGRPLTVPSQRLVMFWAGIPHQTIALDRGARRPAMQCLPAARQFPAYAQSRPADRDHAGRRVVALQPGTLNAETLQRWFQDYRSGDAERADILKEEIALMLRRAAATGWDVLMDPGSRPSVRPTAGTPLRYAVAMMRHILEHLKTKSCAPKMWPRWWAFTPITRSTCSPK